MLILVKFLVMVTFIHLFILLFRLSLLISAFIYLFYFQLVILLLQQTIRKLEMLEKFSHLNVPILFRFYFN